MDSRHLKFYHRQTVQICVNLALMETSTFILPFDYCHRWIRAAFNMAEKHFSLFVILGIIVFVTEVVAGFVPYLGALANPVLRFVYTLGSLRMMDQLMQQKTVNTEGFLRLSFDQSYWPRFQKYFLACIGIGLITEVGMWASLPHFYLLSAALNVALFLVPFVAYHSLRNPHLSDKEAMDYVLRQSWKNIGNLLLHALFLMALGLVAMALCVVPFFLYFLPLTFPLVYLVYMGLCEQKTIEDLNATWKTQGA